MSDKRLFATLLASTLVLASASAVAQQTPAPTDPAANPAPDQTPPGPLATPDQAPPGATVTNVRVSNGPVADTPENRAKYGKPLSHAGRRTAPRGN